MSSFITASFASDVPWQGSVSIVELEELLFLNCGCLVLLFGILFFLFIVTP